MYQALVEARKAEARGEVPVGAVVVHRGRILGRGHNQREALQQATAHAEMAALNDASAKLGSWRLEFCTMYVTLEPCTMCAGALVQARLERLVFGCWDPKGGSVRSLYRVCEDHRLNHQVRVTQGILENECAVLLSRFFANIRRQKTLEKP